MSGISPSDSDNDFELDGEVLSLKLTTAEAGERLDRALIPLLGDMSRARLQSLIEAGHLSLDGHTITDGKHKAKAGDYSLFVPAPISATPAPQNIPLDIIFEDEHLIVFNKPAGMAAHPAPGTPDRTLVNALLYHCKDSLSGIGGVLRPGIVHRLDKDTSGVMVAAKSDRAHHGLSDLFSRHDIERAYLAIVRGTPKSPSGTITTQIGRSPHDRKKMAVLKSGGREAITHYSVLQTFGPRDKPLASLIRCQLETGRTHQIRVHMAHMGMPCLGDQTYGSGGAAKSVEAQITEAGLTRQALHATLLGFIHPITREILRFEAPPPDDMQRLLQGLLTL